MSNGFSVGDHVSGTPVEAVRDDHQGPHGGLRLGLHAPCERGRPAIREIKCDKTDHVAAHRVRR
jgi:hypothetical protein